MLYADEVDGSANDFALITRTFTAVDACGNCRNSNPDHHGAGGARLYGRLGL